ncbi:glycogen debranching N-terminal domain-containing protein [Lacisediminihabitans changchengi]|uniref:Amylo-alpha-1,6-glucosidase n=1 Tax=Lacisediminihabitans changchengi TaxID=2787634 RepID=A0A934STA4_9MICO|nr:glycogen debranching N-terminal domain-containing protein [Lacisediminihabitans changchengi]MBK4348545.1 amylo-alpha-1,6-glucosidase [Lacisediminihabitans changchengi]
MVSQPLLHDATVILRAPTQAWSAPDGAIGDKPIHGIYHSDVRVVSSETVTVGDLPGEHIATSPGAADTVTFVSLLRHLDDTAPDPRVRALLTRTVTAGGASSTLTVESTLTQDVTTTVVVRIESDLAAMELVKSGDRGEPVTIDVVGATASWSNGPVSASVTAAGAELVTDERALELRWTVLIPAKGSVDVGWHYTMSDAEAVVRGVTTPVPWSVPVLAAGDDRLARWVSRALDDLDGLRLTTAHSSGEFLAAGAPWFFTLFGRDSIWAARFMLPLGTALAADTLRVLAGLQGTTSVAETAEQPGKVMHELRRGQLTIPGEGISLPPLYYGTVDATPLWACLLHDAWRWGMPDDEVRALLPNLVAALEWMRDFGDADGDGLLEYVDETGHGLSNQGWKDSGDSVQWRDGSLAEGPIALCEVQAYAYEAATHGADLLDHFGLPGADEWRAWAARLQTRFREMFWIASDDGAYPAIALDAQKRAVDTVTSNLGHLLGTGLLDDREARLVARRLGSPELDSGYGLRTMSTDSVGYWPLSYHGGSVWAHDTAIAISGLTRDGFHAEASSLASGLLAAAAGFDYRMPELHSGDAAAATSVPLPYPAACRPQAWSAAAAISVLGSTLGLVPSAQDGSLHVSPSTTVGALSVSGLRLGTADVAIQVSTDGEVIAASGADITVG